MARVRLAAAAVEDLRELILTHELPPNTTPRVVRRLRALTRFPEMGRALSGHWDGTRYLLGPWPWLVIVYEYDAGADTVTVLTMQDARRASSPTNE
ncbi:MAG TPA: type II toxin-antitoxin system RelE/ParE family toxin [Conexibacter sp.]|nr:type II toxin-antitoxin system RelE/ParE family toxin [Conexibacter sp.]